MTTPVFVTITRPFRGAGHATRAVLVLGDLGPEGYTVLSAESFNHFTEKGWDLDLVPSDLVNGIDPSMYYW